MANTNHSVSIYTSFFPKKLVNQKYKKGIVDGRSEILTEGSVLTQQKDGADVYVLQVIYIIPSTCVHVF